MLFNADRTASMVSLEVPSCISTQKEGKWMVTAADTFVW